MKNYRFSKCLVGLVVFWISRLSYADLIDVQHFRLCTIINSGLWCSGFNDTGMIGTGVLSEDFRPYYCNTGSAALRLTADKSLYGYPYPVSVKNMSTGVTSINGSCALRNGAVFCWGPNVNGQVGDGTQHVMHGIPKLVAGLESGVTEISQLDMIQCALKDGGVWCWGDNGWILGDSNGLKKSLRPILIPGLEKGVTSLGNGKFGTNACFFNGWGASLCVLKGTGVSCAPLHLPVAFQNRFGNVQEFEWPFQPPGLDSDVSAVYGAVVSDSKKNQVFNGCVIKRKELWCSKWYFDAEFSFVKSSYDLMRVAGLPQNQNVVKYVARYPGQGSRTDAGTHNNSHLVLLENGEVWTWGAPHDRRMGDYVRSPQQIKGLPSDVIDIGSSVLRGCALTRSSELWCWGHDPFNGDVKDNDTTIHPPRKIEGLPLPLTDADRQAEAQVAAARVSLDPQIVADQASKDAKIALAASKEAARYALETQIAAARNPLSVQAAAKRDVAAEAALDAELAANAAADYAQLTKDAARDAATQAYLDQTIAVLQEGYRSESIAQRTAIEILCNKLGIPVPEEFKNTK